jgi:hypothetical protein
MGADMLTVLLVFAAGPAVPARLEGVVVDRSGKPVAKAAIIAQGWPERALATSDERGRFSLRSPLGGPALLFVSRAGFRFHGQVMGGGKIVLTRRTEKPTGKMRTLPPLLPLEKRQALVGRLMKKEFDEAVKSGKEDASRVLKLLARTDPARLIEALEKKPLTPWYDGYVRREAVKHVAVIDFDEALALAESVKDPGFRCACLMDLHDLLPEAKKAERRKLLASALVACKGVTGNDHRIIDLAWLGRRYLALGDRKKAVALFKEGHVIAKELPTAGWAGYARAAFAVNLALVDQEGAPALLKGLKEAFEVTRHNANLAERVAALNPGLSEKMLRTAYSGGLSGQERTVSLVCARMVTADPKRARKLADEVSAGRAMVLAAMAQGLAASPEKALPLLDEAFDMLGKSRHPNNPANALLLLPIVEKVDPALVPEFFWHALSLHRSDIQTNGHVLALGVARYDRALGRALRTRARRALAEDTDGSRHTLLAAAQIDPPRALALFADMKENAQKPYYRMVLAQGLLMTPAEAAESLRFYQWWGLVRHDEDD